MTDEGKSGRGSPGFQQHASGHVKTCVRILILPISIHDCFPTAPSVCLDMLLTARSDGRPGRKRRCLAYGQVSSGRFTTIGVEVLLTTTQ
jgi:hypothetical protein